MTRFRYAIWAIIVIVAATAMNLTDGQEDGGRGWESGRYRWSGPGGRK